MKKLILSILTIILLISCNKNEESNTQTEEVVYKSISLVESTDVTKASLIEYVKSNGRCAPISEIDIYNELSGTIKSIKVSNNVNVSKGDTILVLDDSLLRVRLAQEMVIYDKKKAEYDAWMELKPESDEFQLKRQTGLITSELKLKEYQLNLEKYYVKAPISGVLTNFMLTEGQYLNSLTNVGQIINNSEMEIMVDIIEDEITKVKLNAPVCINFLNASYPLVYGYVKSISPKLNSETSTCEVIVSYNNTAGVKAGMYADVKIESVNYGERIIIPKEAVVRRDNRTLVFLVKNGKSCWQYVKLGKSNEYFYEVLDGCVQGDEVITQGNFSLAHNANLRVGKHHSFNDFYKRY